MLARARSWHGPELRAHAHAWGFNACACSVLGILVLDPSLVVKRYDYSSCHGYG